MDDRPIITPRGIYRYNCPFCEGKGKTPDTKHHLYYDPNRAYKGVKGQFVCFRCGARGDAKKLRHYLAIGVMSMGAIDAKLTSFYFNLKDEQEDGPCPEPDCRPIFPGSQEEKYLLGRGFSQSHIRHYNLMAGTERLSRRIVIPAYMNGKLAFWQARAIYPNPKAKYISPPSGHRKGTVFNWDTAKEFDRVLIHEGPLNAVIAGLDSVATFGKEVGPDQIKTLTDSRVKEFVICLDDDAVKWSAKLVNKLRSAKPSLSIGVVVPPKGKDAVDLGMHKFRGLLESSYFDMNNECGIGRMLLGAKG